jgi:hypothetical protein
LAENKKMNTLQIPKQNISQCETPFDKINAIRTHGAKALIDQVNWKDVFPKTLPVSVQLAHDGEQLYLYYMVTGEELRAVNTKDFGSIWEDSCVEFFMQREGEKTYRNFECNPLGALLAAHREARDTAQDLVHEMPAIVRHTAISHKYNESGQQVSDWALYLEIPKKALGFAENESLSGQKIRANFYKCGDNTPEPHFLSWCPIGLPKPNFHAPQFFGTLELV